MCGFSKGDKMMMTFLAALVAMGLIILEVCIEEFFSFSLFGVPLIRCLLGTDMPLWQIVGGHGGLLVFALIAFGVAAASLYLLYDMCKTQRD